MPNLPAKRMLLIGLILVGGCNKESPRGVSGRIAVSPPVGGSGGGTLAVEDVANNNVQVRGTLKGMKPGDYVVHLHGPRGCLIGPTGEPPEGHLREIGRVVADANGNAEVALTIDGARLGGMEPITGHCIVLYPPDLSSYAGSGTIQTPGFVGH